MRATPEAPAEVMCEAADVSTRGADDAKGQERRVQGDDLELLDLNLHWSEFDRPVLSRKLVGWQAADLLRRKWRWRLIDSAGKRAHGRFDIADIGVDGPFFAGWCTVLVVGIRREAEPDFSFVDFGRVGDKLGQPCGFADGHGQDAGCHRIERAEMAYPGCAELPADRVY